MTRRKRPSREVVVVHGLIGAGTAAMAARGEQAVDVVTEALGGAAAGVMRALVGIEPDVMRRYAAANAKTWQASCRARAADHDRLALQTADGWMRAFHFLAAFLWRLASGFVAAVALPTKGAPLILPA